jgi:DNA-binding NtrC family response regulator
MALERILVLDDEMVIRKALEEQLRRRRFSVVGVATLADATRHLEKNDFDLVFLDVRLPDGDGTELLERLAASPGSPLVVMITGHGSIESAVNCMRAGAFDYVIKPFSINQIEVVLKKAESFSQLVKVNQFHNQESENATELIGDGAVMEDLRKLTRRVAPTEATVLISGENGTGKELVANELFRASARSQKPFIRVNCAAISEALIESEFFGHEKGSFTGADQDRMGRILQADGGTLFLDEIGDVSSMMQLRLLRFLQEKTFYPVGRDAPIQVDVRIIAATNVNLREKVQQGKFREDLYFRLRVIDIILPPLRERTGDIPLLTNNFIQYYAQQMGKSISGISDQAMALFSQYQWPGNVRELQHVIERSCVLTTGATISKDQLPLEILHQQNYQTVPQTPAIHQVVGIPSPSPPSFNNSFQENSLESRILAALQKSGGNKAKAARLLSIDRSTLYRKLKELNIDLSSFDL